MVEFIHNDKQYKYIPYKDLKEEDLPKGKRKDNTIEYYELKGHHKKNPFVDLGCGFDIETTRIAGTKKSTMYVWQFSIDDITIIGRTWDEFRELLTRLQKHYHLSDGKRLLVWIHNEKFEFSFIKSQLQWKMKDIKVNGMVVDRRPDIFALDKREVIKATTVENVEFRDSLVLTQLPLAKLAKDYNLGIEKLKGDLDYTLSRHFATKLTFEELAYCINDVQILSRFYHNYIYTEYIKNEIDIPLTMTGIVRNELKRDFRKLDKKEKNRYKKLISKCMLSETLYDILVNELYRGGYNHANKIYSDIEIDNWDMGSFDFKSSYPAVMLHEKYPYEFKEVSTDYFYAFAHNRKWCKNNAYFGHFKIKNVNSKLSHSLESENKIIEYSEDAKFDNGRLISASWIEVWLTEQDVLNYFDFYTVEDLSQWECYELYTSKKEYLPKFLLDLVLKYFALKEQLQKGTLEYAIAKAKLNSLYGMIVSALVYGDLKFDTNSLQFIDGYCEKSYQQVKDKTILLPQWGVWVTAYARRNLVHTFSKLEDSAMYGDTDSVKLINTIGNQYVFDCYNDNIIRMNKTMYVGDYDRNLFMKIGIFDYEGKIFKFKTLGCKRYLHSEVEFNKKTEKFELVHNSTVAGMRKGSLQEYCEVKDLDIYEEFTDGLELSEEFADKMTTEYIDEEFVEEVTDYQGNTEIVREGSCCTLYSIPFSLSLSKDYVKLLGVIVNAYQLKGRRYI